jgi:membrane protein YdbS with pleckstrin-like domain
MEFEDLKKMWHSQDEAYIYSIDEEALHNRIKAKQRQAYHTAHVSEWLSIGAFVVAGGAILVSSWMKSGGSLYMYLLAGWMLAAAVYLFVSRTRRIKGQGQFERTMRGDLEYAISLATYQVRLSGMLRWNLPVVGIFILLSFWQSGQSLWAILGFVVFLTLAHFAAGWEHGIYKNRKRELEILKGKLEEEEVPA